MHASVFVLWLWELELNSPNDAHTVHIMCECGYYSYDAGFSYWFCIVLRECRLRVGKLINMHCKSFVCLCFCVINE